MKTLAAVMLVLLMGGCRSSERDASPVTPDRNPAHQGSPRPEPQRDDVLRIAPEMLRDVRVTTAPAERRPSGEGVTALGELRVNEDAYVEIGSPVSARVISVLVPVGALVRAQQALVEVRSVELGKARAEYLRARAEVDLTTHALERKESLAAEHIVPLRELQEAAAAAAAAAAELRAAEASLHALGMSGDDGGSSEVTLRSPIAGTVIERTAVRGQMADPATPLMRIADLSRLWLVAHVFERDVVRLSPGADARVTFPALPGRTFAARIALVGKQVEVSSRTVPVRIEIANEEGVLRPGMSAAAWMALGEAEVPIVAVPVAALQRWRDQWCVFVPATEGTFEIRAVGRGRDLGGEVEVLNGLQAGELVVADGAFLLKAEADRARGEGEPHEH